VKVLGLVMANHRAETLRPLTKKRTSAALPVFGKYRAIDFTLSNMVNAGISKIGIVTQYSPRSLMDHLGSGKEWDLDRKRGGLFILQPYDTASKETLGYVGSADALFQNMTILKRGNEDYTLISDGDSIYKIDFSKMFRAHIETGADITVLTARSEFVKHQAVHQKTISDETGRVVEWKMEDENIENEKFSVPLGVYFMNKFLLRELLYANVPEGKVDFVKDIIASNVDSLRVVEYRFEGYWRNLKCGLDCYYKTNLDILSEEVRQELFYQHGKIYTKLKDLPPPKITGTARVSNSMISDGSIISGRIHNSVLFRNVKVLAGAIVKNSVVLEGCLIEEGAYVENAVLDKNTVIRSGRRFIGSPEKPAIAEKFAVL